MRLLPILASAAAVILAATGLRAEPYRIDHDHSSITFDVNHLGFSQFHGRFNRWRGEIDFDPSDIEATRVRIDIDADSFDTGSRLRDDNTRYFPDMLNVRVFPKISFNSTEVVLTSAESARMTGSLTIRDVTLPVSFDIRLNARGVTAISHGKEVFGFTATTVIDRVAFGIGFAAPAVSGKVPVRVDIEIMPAD